MKKKKCSTCKQERLECICANGFTVSDKEKFYWLEVKKVIN